MKKIYHSIQVFTILHDRNKLTEQKLSMHSMNKKQVNTVNGKKIFHQKYTKSIIPKIFEIYM